ncbi:hypothetical protein BH23CYA1_BH23CYA1_11850 [soil metagenome]
MPIYQVCKAVVTGAAIASATLLTVSCSPSMETQAATDNNAAVSDASSDAQSQAMDHGEMDHGEMDHGEADHGEMDHDDAHSHHDQMLEVPAGTPVPDLTVRVDPDPVRGWNLYVGTTNFEFAPEKINSESSPSEGHAHLYINGESAQRIYGNWTHLAELPPGENELRVTLNANGHEALAAQGIPIEETVTVAVDEPN